MKSIIKIVKARRENIQDNIWIASDEIASLKDRAFYENDKKLAKSYKRSALKLAAKIEAWELALAEFDSTIQDITKMFTAKELYGSIETMVNKEHPFQVDIEGSIEVDLSKNWTELQLLDKKHIKSIDC